MMQQPTLQKKSKIQQSKPPSQSLRPWVLPMSWDGSSTLCSRSPPGQTGLNYCLLPLDYQQLSYSIMSWVRTEESHLWFSRLSSVTLRERPRSKLKQEHFSPLPEMRCYPFRNTCTIFHH